MSSPKHFWTLGNSFSKMDKKTDAVTDDLEFLRISSSPPPIKRGRSNRRPNTTASNEDIINLGDELHSNCRVRPMESSNKSSSTEDLKRKIPLKFHNGRKPVRISIHKDIKDFSPEYDIPESILARYRDCNSRALVLYKPPSSFLPDLIKGVSNSKIYSKENECISPHNSSFTTGRSRRNSAPETGISSDEDQKMDI